jgi:hypothetical protein
MVASACEAAFDTTADRATGALRSVTLWPTQIVGVGDKMDR